MNLYEYENKSCTYLKKCNVGRYSIIDINYFSILIYLKYFPLKLILVYLRVSSKYNIGT